MGYGGGVSSLATSGSRLTVLVMSMFNLDGLRRPTTPATRSLRSCQVVPHRPRVTLDEDVYQHSHSVLYQV
jgi:hypothetical protein